VNLADSAYRLGRIACADGKRLDDNPHPQDDPQFNYWNRGWAEEFRTLPTAIQSARQSKEPNHADE
jgi:hypothetical protein